MIGLAIYAAIGLFLFAWSLLNAWNDGWDSRWSVFGNIVIMLLFAALWPILLLWVAWAVLSAGWSRRF